ncbi:MAG: ABC transporter ATP-binding protein [Thermoleophilia bacterium]|nr:ABC transporter ATP-binding protein [Thermoleophilia bacterium]
MARRRAAWAGIGGSSVSGGIPLHLPRRRDRARPPIPGICEGGPVPASPAPPALRLDGVHKSFGDVHAVAGLDLEVPVGTCVGLLGPNGAGKSTTVKLLTAQCIPDSGTIDVLGLPLPGQSKSARALMGVVPQLDNLDTTLTVRQNLVVFAHLYRVPRHERRAAVDRALEIALLTDRADAKVTALSGGMRRRLLIARALLHGPRLVLMDEPTVGLDPQVRQEIWALIDALRTQGTSILMSTHYIEEAARLCDTVVIVAHGTAVATGAPAELVREHAGEMALEVYGPPDALARAEADAQAAGVRTRRTGTSVSLLRLDAATGPLPDGEHRPANLEDVFVLLTGEEIG